MTFEEFFKKKKISLPALRGAEPALFTEFEHHYAQMGEKSFDHTKKYWFNKLRRQYPLPPEEKPEKVRMENPLAEQTVTETIAQEASPVTRPGFTPRFKAPAKPATPISEKQPGEPEPVPEHKIIKQETDTPPADTPKPAYKPKFKAPVKSAGQESAPAEEKADAVGAQSSLPKPESVQPPAEEKKPATAPKLAFKPRFKPGVTQPATSGKEPEPTTLPAPAEKPSTDIQPTAEAAPGAGAGTPQLPVDAPKPAYKPRFTPKMVKPKPPEE